MESEPKTPPCQSHSPVVPLVLPRPRPEEEGGAVPPVGRWLSALSLRPRRFPGINERIPTTRRAIRKSNFLL